MCSCVAHARRSNSVRLGHSLNQLFQHADDGALRCDWGCKHLYGLSLLALQLPWPIKVKTARVHVGWLSLLWFLHPPTTFVSREESEYVLTARRNEISVWVRLLKHSLCQLNATRSLSLSAHLSSSVQYFNTIFYQVFSTRTLSSMKSWSLFLCHIFEVTAEQEPLVLASPDIIVTFCVRVCVKRFVMVVERGTLSIHAIEGNCLKLSSATSLFRLCGHFIYLRLYSSICVVQLLSGTERVYLCSGH